EPMTLVVGAKMHDPIHDALPTTSCGAANLPCHQAETPASGGCLCDSDQDGNPGVTISVKHLPFFEGVHRFYSVDGLGIKISARPSDDGRLVGTMDTTDPAELDVGCRQAGGDCTPQLLSLLLKEPVTIAPAAERTSTFVGKRVDAAFD